MTKALNLCPGRDAGYGRRSAAGLLICLGVLWVTGLGGHAGQRKGQTVLTLSRPAGASSRSITYDLDALERLGLAQLTARDVHLEKVLNYSGVPVARLIEVAAPRDQVEKVRFYASDGYMVELPAALLRQYPVLLATRIEGKHSRESNVWEWGPHRINMGPLYLVFPNQNQSGASRPEFSRNWNWIFGVERMVLLRAGEGLSQLDAQTPAEPEARRGLDLFRRDCAYCHQVFGQGGHQGPPLDRIMSVRSKEYVKRYIADPQAVLPTARMPKMSDWGTGFGAAELDALAAYLKFVHDREQQLRRRPAGE